MAGLNADGRRTDSCKRSRTPTWLYSCPYFREVALELGAVLRKENAAIEHVYFPLTGIVSLHIHMACGRSVETNAVGHDRGIDLTAGLGIDTIAGRAVVQVPGRAMRISKSQFALVHRKTLLSTT
jgi:hypothetical protein